MREAAAELRTTAAEYGISAAAFAHMTPEQVNADVSGWRARAELRAEEANANAWLTGAYVRIALSSVLDPEVEYPEKPLGMGKSGGAEWETGKMKMAGFAARVKRGMNAKSPERSENRRCK